MARAPQGSSGEPLRRLLLAARAHPRITVAAVVALGAALWLGARFVFPSEEQMIARALRGVQSAVVEGDAEKVMQHVSPYFSEQGINAAMLERRLRVALEGRPVSSARFVFREHEVFGRMAEARIVVFSTHKTPYRTAQANSEWLVELQKAEDRWLVRGAEPLRVEGRRAGGLGAVLWMAY